MPATAGTLSSLATLKGIPSDVTWRALGSIPSSSSKQGAGLDQWGSTVQEHRLHSSPTKDIHYFTGFGVPSTLRQFLLSVFFVLDISLLHFLFSCAIGSSWPAAVFFLPLHFNFSLFSSLTLRHHGQIYNSIIFNVHGYSVGEELLTAEGRSESEAYGTRSILSQRLYSLTWVNWGFVV